MGQGVFNYPIMNCLSCHFLCIYHSLLNTFILIQICDFGLAKWLPKQWTHYNASKFEGTFGWVSLWDLWFDGQRGSADSMLYLFVWQLFCTRILHEWHSGWKNRYIFFRSATFGTHYRTPSCGPNTAKPCSLGMFLSVECGHTAHVVKWSLGGLCKLIFLAGKAIAI